MIRSFREFLLLHQGDDSGSLFSAKAFPCIGMVGYIMQFHVVYKRIAVAISFGSAYELYVVHNVCRPPHANPSTTAYSYTQ